MRKGKVGSAQAFGKMMGGFTRGLAKTVELSKEGLSKTVKGFEKVGSLTVQGLEKGLALGRLGRRDAEEQTGDVGAQREEAHDAEEDFVIEAEEYGLLKVLEGLQPAAQRGGEGDLEFVNASMKAVLDSMDSDVDLMEPDNISLEQEKLTRIQNYVEQYLRSTVSSNPESFVNGLGKVQELEIELQLTFFIVKAARRQITQAKAQLERGAMGILSDFKKKQLASEIIALLRGMQSVMAAASRVKVHLKDFQFDEASRVVEEARDWISAVSGIVCMKSCLEDLTVVERQFESRLWERARELIVKFDGSQFSLLYDAFQSRGIGEMFVQRIEEQMVDATQTQCLATVLSFSNQPATSFSVTSADQRQKSIDGILSKLSDESAISCLVDLFEVITDQILSLDRACKWASANGESMSNVNAALESGRRTVWTQTVTLVSGAITACKASGFKLEKFLHLSHAVQLFVSTADRFGLDTRNLIGFDRMLSINYFKSFHADRVDILIGLIENEAWNRFPVEKGFTVHSIRELQPYLGEAAQRASKASKAVDMNINPFTSFAPPSFVLLQNIQSDGVVFKKRQDDDDDDEALKADTIDEDASSGSKITKKDKLRHKSDHKREQSGPILTAASMSLIKFIGEYLQIMQVLKSLSSEAFNGVSQLFRQYLFCVISFFIPPNDSAAVSAAIDNGLNLLEAEHSNAVSAKLASALSSLRQNFARDDKKGKQIGGGLVDGLVSEKKRQQLLLNRDMVDLCNRDTLWGLSNRCVGFESVALIADVLKMVKPSLVSLTTTKDGPSKEVSAFYSQFVDGSRELKDIFYSRLPPLMCNLYKPMDLPSAIASVKWDIDELAHSHSAWTEQLAAVFNTLCVQLVRIGDSLSEEERQRVLTSCLHYCMTVVVDGFGRVKKCTDEGRMLMSVDFSSLIRNLERVTRVSPIPNSKYVEEFIGCFFIPENQLLDWVQVHPEYSPKHVLAVMSLMTVKYDMKRSKKKEFIEEVEKILRANGHSVEEHSSLSLFGASSLTSHMFPIFLGQLESNDCQFDRIRVRV